MGRKNIKILIVDDNDKDLNSLVDCFEKEGVSVFKTTNASKAFELYKTHSPHLIITEFVLSHSTGLDLVRKLKTIKKEKKVPIIMYSYQNNTFDKDWALSQGVDNYIVKPIRHLDLIKISKYLIKKYKSG